MATKTKPAAKVKLLPQEAVLKAQEFLLSVYPKEDLAGLRLEAVELSDDHDWLVTLSFVPRSYEGFGEKVSRAQLSLGLPNFNQRLYKEVRVRATDGLVHSMTSATS